MTLGVAAAALFDALFAAGPTTPLVTFLMALSAAAVPADLAAVVAGIDRVGDATGICTVICVEMFMLITSLLFTSSYVADGMLAVTDGDLDAWDRAALRLLGSPFMRLRIIWVAAVNWGMYGADPDILGAGLALFEAGTVRTVFGASFGGSGTVLGVCSGAIFGGPGGSVSPAMVIVILNMDSELNGRMYWLLAKCRRLWHADPDGFVFDGGALCNSGKIAVSYVGERYSSSPPVRSL